MKHIEIELRNKKIFIGKSLYDAIVKTNYNPSGNDLEKIFSLKSPHSSTKEICFSQNIGFALARFLYISKFGRFVQYFPDGTKQMSDDLYELVKDHTDDGCLYGFEELDKKDVIPQKTVINFFGSKISSIFYVNIKNELLPYMLSEIIKDDLKYIKKLAKGNKDVFIRDLKWRMFKACRDMMLWHQDNNRIRSRNKAIHESEYLESLNNLLSKYSVDGKTLFEKVDIIQSYNKSIGIYVLCMKDMRRIYVGQAKSSIGRRVLQHFSHKNSGFDNSVLPGDITDIYILKTPSDVSLINIIESDCIATVGKNITANSLSSEFNLQSTSDKDYISKDYMIPNNQLKKIKAVLNELK